MIVYLVNTTMTQQRLSDVTYISAELKHLFIFYFLIHIKFRAIAYCNVIMMNMNNNTKASNETQTLQQTVMVSI